MEKEKRSALDRVLWSLGSGGVNAGLGGLFAPPGSTRATRARLAAGAGVAGLAGQAGSEIGGFLGNDSFGSRAAGGALGGALGGAASVLVNPQSSLLYKFLIQRGGLSPKKATALLLGAGALGGAPSGAIGGLITRPSED